MRCVAPNPDQCSLGSRLERVDELAGDVRAFALVPEHPPVRQRLGVFVYGVHAPHLAFLYAFFAASNARRAASRAWAEPMCAASALAIVASASASAVAAALSEARSS
jgi:hypothetical protein